MMKRFLAAAAAAFALSGSVPPATGQARDLDARIAAMVKEINPDLITVRRDLHQHPELSLQEKRTSGIVADRFRALGLEVRTGIRGTGVLGVLRGAKPGPIIGYRADMDALPITEETGLPFASKERGTRNGREVGIMHACGHDIHTTVMLGTAAVLSRLKAEIPGTVLFIAQPAEEYGGGAAEMIKEGVFRDFKPEALFAFHIDDTIPAGTIKYVPGYVLANVDGCSLAILSEGGHGANPSFCVDPIVVGSQIVVALQVMISRQLHVHDDTVITVGSFQAGSASNIIPRRADLQITVRTYGDDQRRLVREKIETTVAGICQAAGAKYELAYQFGTPATYNDPETTRRAAAVAERVIGKNNVILDRPDMGGEDFSYFAREAPAAMLTLGVQPPGATATLHSPYFVADEGGIPSGVRVMAAVLLDRLNRPANQR